MQLESKDFYKLVSGKHGIPIDLVKSIGDCVFKELADLQRDPPNLILDVRKLGRRFVRKKKLYEKLDKVILDHRDFLNSNMRFPKNREEIDEELMVLTRLQTWYESYLEEKAHKKTQRREYSSSNQSDTSSQTLRTASPDNTGECPGVHSRKHAISSSQDGISQASDRD